MYGRASIASQRPTSIATAHQFKPPQPNPSERPSGLRLGLHHPPPDEPEDQRPEHDQGGEGDAGDQPVSIDRLRSRASQVVGDKPDKNRPADATGRVPAEEPP